jgi:type IV pilus assembly protein PilB
MKKRIGDILIEMGFIDNDQLRMALAETKKTGAMLGDSLLRLDWISEEQLQMAIAVQSGAKILDTETVNIDLGLIAKIPKEYVISHGVFPFAIEEGIIRAATSNPFDVIARDKLGRMTGSQVETYIAPKEWISNAIELYYETALNIDRDVEIITASGLTGLAFEEDKIIRLADLLIEKGRVVGASDIHIEPDTNLVRIYYRIDGVLHQNYIFAKTFHQGLVSRFKIMGDMDISNPNIPHDGRIRYKGSFGELDLRVSTFPTHLGETVVLRLLLYSKVVGDLEGLGFEEEDLARFLHNIKRPYGLILTTGPTGSGKTTTLYTALMTINNPNINVMTVEDPIEYIIPTIRQTAVNPKAGLTFGNALRSAMRQDPDVILVGEIRDKETADLAMGASITGHLVLSTLHTNDAASSINRLLDLGVNSSILASALTMVVAQRLLRKLCPHCSTKAELTQKERDVFEQNGFAPPSILPKAVGCESCFNSGYSGRAGIYEVIQVDREIQELIFAGSLHRLVEDAATKAGTSLMLRQGLKKVIAQITTLEEVFRVIDFA